MQNLINIMWFIGYLVTVNCVDVIIQPFTNTEEQKYLTHNLKIINTRLEDMTVYWNLDANERGRYRIRTGKYYLGMAGKDNTLIKKNGGDALQKVSDEEKIRKISKYFDDNEDKPNKGREIDNNENVENDDNNQDPDDTGGTFDKRDTGSNEEPRMTVGSNNSGSRTGSGSNNSGNRTGSGSSTGKNTNSGRRSDDDGNSNGRGNTGNYTSNRSNTNNNNTKTSPKKKVIDDPIVKKNNNQSLVGSFFDSMTPELLGSLEGSTLVELGNLDYEHNDMALSQLVGKADYQEKDTSSKAKTDSGTRAKYSRGFIFDIFPVFINPLDKRAVLSLNGRCLTHEMVFEDCEFEDYWDLRDNLYWNIYRVDNPIFLKGLKKLVDDRTKNRDDIKNLQNVSPDKCRRRADGLGDGLELGITPLNNQTGGNPVLAGGSPPIQPVPVTNASPINANPPQNGGFSKDIKGGTTTKPTGGVSQSISISDNLMKKLFEAAKK